MPRYEYKIVPAPEKASKIKGLKGPERFAATIEHVMNEMGAEGWQYLRADTLPQEERTGLTGKARHERNLLIFQREIEDEVEEHPAAPSFSRPYQDPPLTRPRPEATAPLAEAFEIDEADHPDYPDHPEYPPNR